MTCWNGCDERDDRRVPRSERPERPDVQLKIRARTLASDLQSEEQESVEP